MQNAIIPKTTPSLNHPIAVNQRKAPQLLIPCPSWLNPAPDPSAPSVKPLRFAPMNAHPAGLTARTDRRLPPPRRAFAFHAPLRVARRQKTKPSKENKSMQETNKAALFPLGQIVATPGALAALAKAGQTPLDFLTRHVCGDWGELDTHDRKENELGLKRGFRLLSSYRTSSGDTKVWVITEADRSVTTVLLPEEY